MKIGLPKEIKDDEFRVAMLPWAVAQLVRRGHQVWVQKSAGIGSGYSDDEYLNAGATMTETAEDVFGNADLIIKVKEPQACEYALLRKDQILFTYLHLAANRHLTEALIQSGTTAIAYETLTVKGHLPLLEPMSEIAGRMSIVVGGYFLAKHQGGNGILLGGVPGVLPGRVLILGGGTAGMNAARMATGLGADVTVMEIDRDRMRFLDVTLNAAHTLYSSEDHLLELLPRVDVLVGAVLVPGAKAPKLIRRSMLERMRPGSVLVDIAIDQGGCAETSKPTTHHDPVYTEEGVVHYCVANMPGAYARTASQALSSIILPYIQLMADNGLAGACNINPSLTSGINVRNGAITCKAVGEAHEMPWHDI